MKTSSITEIPQNPGYRGGPYDHESDGQKKDGISSTDQGGQMFFLPILPPLGCKDDKENPEPQPQPQQ